MTKLCDYVKQALAMFINALPQIQQQIVEPLKQAAISTTDVIIAIFRSLLGIE